MQLIGANLISGGPLLGQVTLGHPDVSVCELSIVRRGRSGRAYFDIGLEVLVSKYWPDPRRVRVAAVISAKVRDPWTRKMAYSRVYDEWDIDCRLARPERVSIEAPLSAAYLEQLSVVEIELLVGPIV